MNFNDYMIIQLLSIGMDECGLIKGYAIQPPKTKGQKRIIDLFKKLYFPINGIALTLYDKKFKNLFNGLEQSKYLKEWSPLLTGLSYAKDCADKQLIKIHPENVQKTIEILKNEDNFKYLDKFTLNSFKIAEILFNQVNKEK